MAVNDAPPELAPGGPPPGAAWLNQLVAYLGSCGIKLDAGSGLVGSTGAGGTTVGVQETPDLVIKITYVGVTGSYSWIEQVAASGGSWTDGFRKGFTSADPARGSVPADPAWEANANATLAVGYRAEASRDASVGRLTFRAGHC